MKNPPAFPMPSGPEPRINDATHYNEGMSLLDYFAGQALVASCILRANGGVINGKPAGSPMTDADLANFSYLFAEAMLAEREKHLFFLNREDR